MRRTIPLLITAAGGFVLVVAHFSPYTQTWGEWAAIWFDILAAIAFILGGGNLLKTHLKKVSDRGAGWAYSMITLLAFLATLLVGLAKWGVPPADKQEFYGQTFTPLAVEDFPQTYSVPGAIPERSDGQRLPDSVGRQLSQETDKQGNESLVFRGWMNGNQKADLQKYKNTLAWQCTVERLAKMAQPPEDLKGKVTYQIDHQALGFKGHMTKEDKAVLLKLGDEAAWRAAVDDLFEMTQVKAEVTTPFVPEGFSDETAKEVSKAFSFDAESKKLTIQGAMSVDHRDALARKPFIVAKPLADEDRAALIAELNDLDPSGDLTEEQIERFNAVLSTGWTVEQLRAELDRAGEAQEVDKSACDMLAEQKAKVDPIEPKKKEGEDQRLSDEQVALLSQFATSPDWSAKRLAEELGSAGQFNGNQIAALEKLLGDSPTEAERKHDLCLALMRTGPVNEPQRDFLLADYRDETQWKQSVGGLFVAAHEVKYSWSGEYNTRGAAFWWLYEYALKPLTATMFAMLAFYVASAAFRAFRAKNVEATLLLITAFVILLGRTYAGTVATGWLPDELSGLRLENLTVTIMKVFNTAGTRAIMIGIALGIASTSLKVLLGIDRSYLGSGED